MKTRTFSLDYDSISAAPRSGVPEDLIKTIREQIGPVAEYVCSGAQRKEIPGLKWMLVELTINAYGALQRNTAVTKHEISIVASSGDGFEILVKNAGRPPEHDREEILRRFQNYGETRRQIERLWEKHTGPDGIVRIPDTAGGGGLALLECIRMAKEGELSFDFYVEESPHPMTVFRIASDTVQPSATVDAETSGATEP